MVIVLNEGMKRSQWLLLIQDRDAAKAWFLPWIEDIRRRPLS